MSDSNKENVADMNTADETSLERREVLKGLATLPVVGVFF